MALNSGTPAINRFTYDWLIRFTELFSPETSSSDRFTMISSFFTTLYENHGVEKVLIEAACNNISTFESLSRNPKKTTVVMGVLWIMGYKKGIVEALLARRIYFHSVELYLSQNQLTPAELKYFIHGYPKCVRIKDCILSEPVNISELWPYMRHTSRLEFHVKNLVYDMAFGDALLKHPSTVKIENFWLINMPYDKNVMLSIIDSFLITKTLPNSVAFTLNVQVELNELKKFAKILLDKIKKAGCQLANKSIILAPNTRLGDDPDESVPYEEHHDGGVLLTWIKGKFSVDYNIDDTHLIYLNQNRE